jgi:hypothetical protein
MGCQLILDRARLGRNGKQLAVLNRDRNIPCCVRTCKLVITGIA